MLILIGAIALFYLTAVTLYYILVGGILLWGLIKDALES